LGGVSPEQNPIVPAASLIKPRRKVCESSCYVKPGNKMGFMKYHLSHTSIIFSLSLSLSLSLLSETSLFFFLHVLCEKFFFFYESIVNESTVDKPTAIMKSFLFGKNIEDINI
jgi:hypothetical protein